jgi:hypothetical protein
MLYRQTLSWLFVTFLLICLTFDTLYSQTEVNIPAKLDNTLYEDASGSFSNGAGSYFFVGKTNQNRIRRGLLKFDIAGNVPAGVTIQSVTLKLHMSKTGGGAQTVALHKVLADWGEGTSNASSNEGSGAPATQSDATWIHRFFNTDLWNTPGGDFSTTVSATQSVAGVGSYTWNSTEQMVADVQFWLDNPSENFGWILIGNEGGTRTTKRFDSRENSIGANLPVLTVTFTGPTDIDDFVKTIPSGFSLAQNFPNPFNPETKIRFQIPKTSQVIVIIFNNLGQEIRQLVNKQYKAGQHEILWNGRDNSGRAVASNMYIYQIQAGEFVDMKKMMLIR